VIISQIVGGLGNQLFQYAAARRMALMLDQEVYLDLTFFDTYHNPDVFRLDKYNVHYKVAGQGDIDRLKRINASGFPAKVYRRIFKIPYYLNSKSHFDQKWLLLNDWNKLKKFNDIYISGYLANPVFFYQIEDVVKKEFTLKDGLNLANTKMLDKISKVNSVMVHVRRGDYVNNDFFTSQPVSYYQKGFQKMIQKIKNPVFFFFSDDLDWTRENLGTDNETYYVDINNGSTDYMELALMSSCKHAIIANSTFSWWGAWLINNPEKMVIAPEKWYTNSKNQALYLKNKIYQEGWIRL